MQEGQTRPQEDYLSMQQEATVKNQQAALKAVKVRWSALWLSAAVCDAASLVYR